MKKFEFVLGKELLTKIENLAKERNSNISCIIRDIVFKMIPILERKHFKEKRREKDYPIVMAVKRVKIYLPEELYNELKVIHDHLNTFSIATLIREILMVYFYGLARFGEKEFEKKVKALEEKIEGIKKNRRSIRKNREDIPTKFAKLYFYLFYHDENFCLQRIKFL
ncbi:MAG TPA: hypothetical protein PLE45_02390 [Spirochaetota bacterium]|nr:hypothetical protein [Spirochaetota bacterium]